MIQVRRSNERGHADHGWLNSYHTFSFSDYYDPKFMGFRSLRVINEDRVAAGQGFGMHGHRDMEIVTYVLEGAIAHRDSMGHEEVLGPNEVQRMSAGTGIRHSEYNASKSDGLHFFQIWIEPAKTGTKPGYEQIRFDPAEKKNRLKLLASPAGSGDGVSIQQDARIFVTDLDQGATVPHSLGSQRGAWVQVVRGKVAVNGIRLETGDAAAITEEERVVLSGTGSEGSEVLLFDMA